MSPSSSCISVFPVAGTWACGHIWTLLHIPEYTHTRTLCGSLQQPALWRKASSWSWILVLPRFLYQKREKHVYKPMCTQIHACLHKCGETCTNGSCPQRTPNSMISSAATRTSWSPWSPSLVSPFETHTCKLTSQAPRPLHLPSDWSGLIFAGVYTLIHTPMLTLVSGTVGMRTCDLWSCSGCGTHAPTFPPRTHALRV